VRESNDDSVIANTDLGLFVVADGVGGNAYGDVASQVAVQTIEKQIRQGLTLTQAVLAANQSICQLQQNDAQMKEMATTVVACLVRGSHYEVAWVGDSRAYVISKSGIEQLTNDHNYANDLYEQGQISQEEAHSHPGQYQLTQALGQLSLQSIPTKSGVLLEGDYMLLCTDGLSGSLYENELFDVISQHASLKARADTLMQEVFNRGAPDNVAFALIQYQQRKKSQSEHRGSLKQLKQDARPSQVERVKRQVNRLGRSLRQPFNQSAYWKHLALRPILLAMIFASITFLVIAL